MKNQKILEKYRRRDFLRENCFVFRSFFIGKPNRFSNKSEGKERMKERKVDECDVSLGFPPS